MKIGRIGALAVVWLLTSAANADSTCQARATLNDHEDSVCDSPSCGLDVEISVEVDECQTSTGSLEANIDIDGPQEREDNLTLSWSLSGDADTTIEHSVTLSDGERIDHVNIGDIDCTCLEGD